MSRQKPRTRRRTRSEGEPERLQKILAAAGRGSRRACEELIRAGRVRVNGTIVRQLGTRAVVGRDRITVDGRRVGRPRRPRYYLVYKPRGVVTTTRDERARKTVLDLVPARERLFPVGRLDAQSEGLLLLTNDGELGQLLLHPSFGIPRTYKVSVEGRVRAESLRKLTGGIMLGARRHVAQSAWLLQQSEERSVIALELVEGRRHQIRKMMEALGHPVRRLVRTGFGPLTLKGLGPGEWRPPTDVEQRALQRLLTLSRKQQSGISDGN